MEAAQQSKEATATDLGWLLDESDDAVVTLIAGETRLVAHRAVLTDRSPVFGAMFRHQTLEASSGSVAIPDVEGPVLRQLVGYLYCLQAPQVPDTAHKLLAAADKYGVSGLKEACERQLVAQLSVETAAAAAVLAIRHGCEGLRTAAIHFIKSHVVEVMATRGWADAVRTQPEDVVEMGRLLSETSTPAPADSGTSAAATAAPQPLGDHRGRQTPASAAPPTAAADHSSPPDEAADSRLRRLPAEERNRRLVKAAAQGAVGELEALLAAGADVADRGGTGWTALHWAAAEGQEEAARRLLAAGAAVDARDSGQATPLHWTARWGHAAVVRLLLAAGADHGATNETGRTPLHWAAYEGHTEAAAALLAAGADTAATDIEGRTPLDTARRYNQQQVEWLLQGR